MSQRPVTQKATAEKVVQDIRRATRRRHSAEQWRWSRRRGSNGVPHPSQRILLGL